MKNQKIAINQKGANGIIAEYQCALLLSEKFVALGLAEKSTIASFAEELEKTITRVGNELTEAQVKRAISQGKALAEYIIEQLVNDPRVLGVTVAPLADYSGKVLVVPNGHLTNSGDPSDITLKFSTSQEVSELPISLKAYKGHNESLGSKSGRASLGRLFCNNEKITDAQFIEFFGTAARDYVEHLSLFKKTAKLFYESDDAKTFLDEYEARKGTRKVNNPLRRKQVGDYFCEKFGFMSEHKLADLYVSLHNEGLKKIRNMGHDHVENYTHGLRFILGNPEMLVLDAKADENGEVSEIVNSLSNPAYMKLNQVLRPGVDLILNNNGNSIIAVQISRNDVTFNGLSLAMWKDGTIQYKIDTRAI